MLPMGDTEKHSVCSLSRSLRTISIFVPPSSLVKASSIVNLAPCKEVLSFLPLQRVREDASRVSVSGCVLCGVIVFVRLHSLKHLQSSIANFVLRLCG